MKTKEFIKQVEALGFSTGKLVSPDSIVVKNNKQQTLAIIDLNNTYQIDTIYTSFKELSQDTQAKLQKLMYKYSRTPIEDREEEKKFYVRVPDNWNRGSFFTKDVDDEKDSYGLIITKIGYKESIFTMQEIKHYHLECFHRDEVK